MDSKSRFHAIRRVLLHVLILNWGVAAAKLVYGWAIDSTSIRADGFHSLSDGASNLVGLFGIWIASHPIDQDHPYGHKKFETLTAIVISGLLFAVCFNVVRESVLRFLHPVVPRVDLKSFGVMAVTLAVNGAVMRYESRMGRLLGSDILVADALHTRSDILTSSTVIFTLAGIRLGYPILDPVGSIIIAAFIGYAAIEILREGARVLSDAAAIPIGEVENVVRSFSGVKECHQIRSRGRRDDIHMDLHVLVDPGMHMGEAHDLSYLIEERIKRNFRGVTDVVIHMEPFENQDDGDSSRERTTSVKTGAKGE